MQKSIEYVCENSEIIEIPKYVIMPNHVHMIIVLNSTDYIGDSNTVGHGSPTLQSVVKRIKSFTTKRWNDMRGTKYQTFWQPRFHEHVIRNETDYLNKWRYIDENPIKWAEDCYNTK